MKDENSQEPIEILRINESKVILLGTAHISKKSVEEVQKIIQKENPDTVCVELCQSRMQSISDPQRWQKLDIFKVFKERKMYLLLSSLILSSFQKKLGLDDVKPGDEMRIAIEEAKKIKAKVIPVDRDISKTLKRAWWNVSFFSKFYLFSVLITSLFVKEEIDSEKIEKMKSRDVLDDLFEQLPKKYSSIKKIIIDERDMYLAQKIRESTQNSKIVFAVVGAGHLKGILNHIQQENYIEHLNTLPEKSTWSSLKTFLPAVIFLSLISTIFLLKDQQTGQDFISKWILLKGGLAALGAVFALAHPLAILTAFVSAPIGTFIPIFKPGWTAALCQIWFKKPLVKDFENIAEDTSSFTGYWKNHVVRIFLVLLLPQIGSSIGTILLTMEAFKIFF